MKRYIIRENLNDITLGSKDPLLGMHGKGTIWGVSRIFLGGTKGSIGMQGILGRDSLTKPSPVHQILVGNPTPDVFSAFLGNL